ncbi:MAG: SDR family NAD(P)-dependent oxidoreductase, partial [Paludibacteraceae bacterium]|nr:SDR family NAD(P)-dependent oxidoreductase [Paludibacteraceae bacterium]
MKKTVFITGASSGIGEACAVKFASQGYNLIINARSADKLEALKSRLEAEYKCMIVVLPFDVRNIREAELKIAAIPDEMGNIDVLINNAGLALGVDKEHEGNF